MDKCYVGDDHAVVLSWSRWARPEEIEAFIGEGRLPEGTTEATVIVISCEEHLMPHPELTHESTCAAPETPCCAVGSSE